MLLAAYDSDAQTGLIKHLGLVVSSTNCAAHVRWVAVNLQLWVDTPAGRGFWKNKAGFAFARAKVASYGLHQMFAAKFDDLDAREELPHCAHTVAPIRIAKRSYIAPERLQPIEVIGEPNASPRGGYVYVLESAYGFKVGRTRNVPNRMRAFGVKLPIVYTILLCAWFDDHLEAETAYHRRFSDKLINGEWFALTMADIDVIRERSYA